MFQVGQHVLCVDDEDHGWGFFTENAPGNGQMSGLRRGVVYTVAGDFTSTAGRYCIVLAEIKRDCPYSIGFAACRFRPLSSDRLSIFRQHLAPSPADKVEA